MKKIFSLLLVLLCASIGYAQTGTVKGFIYEKGSGEPVIYTNVWLLGTGYGVQTDVNGYFSITGIPAGSYTLISTQIGYDSATKEVTIRPGGITTQKLIMSRSGIALDDITVSGRKQERRTLVNAGVTTVTPREMKMLPSAGGEPDIAQYLQVTPGVVFTGDQGGQLYIRGGSPSQTGILLDGVTIYNPFHSIGLFSVFETDAIRSVDIQSAGFNAQYGNRTSAILDIHTRDGNKNRTEGKLSVSPIMARAMLEGPIMKPKDEEGSSITYLLSVKHSYLDQTSKALYGSFGEPFSSGLPYAFTDLYGKVTFSGNSGSKLNLFGFNFDDRAKFLNTQTDATIADFRWTATGGGATFVVSPAGSSALIDGKFAYSKYGIDYNETGQNVPRSSGISGFEGGINFTNFLPGYSQFKYGLEVSGIATNLSYTNNFGYGTSLDRQNTIASLFAIFRKNFSEKFIVEPGLRIQYYATLDKFSPEPRIGMKYNITPNLRLKAAAGLYSQNIISTKNDRDIVNFFTGFLLSPDKTIYKNPATSSDPVQSNLLTAYHILGGVEFDIQHFEFNLEPWFKDFTQNFELNRYKGQVYANGSIDNNDFVFETGKAYGIDFSTKYSNRRLYVWAVMGYQYVDRTDFMQTYPPPFDRRFNANFLAAYTAGKHKDIELSLRYNLGSPFPFTQTQGFYENLNLTSNGIGTNYLQQNGQLGLLYASQVNGGRLSYYHRVDISAKKRFELSKQSNLEATFSITNLFNRNNIFYVNRFDNTRVYQLPIFPSLSLSWNF
ncbi:MAG: TonB-dependent receptor [Bacteroidetes bacterium]|nr:TonB-dependent receptor [Bacteroidota bacterium]MBS1629608.1 TonB-dependent receptor [Bacteroidota bacterium]